MVFCALYGTYFKDSSKLTKFLRTYVSDPGTAYFVAEHNVSRAID